MRCRQRLAIACLRLRLVYVTVGYPAAPSPFLTASSLNVWRNPRTCALESAQHRRSGSPHCSPGAVRHRYCHCHVAAPQGRNTLLRQGDAWHFHNVKEAACFCGMHLRGTSVSAAILIGEKAKPPTPGVSSSHARTVAVHISDWQMRHERVACVTACTGSTGWRFPLQRVNRHGSARPLCPNAMC